MLVRRRSLGYKVGMLKSGVNKMKNTDGWMDDIKLTEYIALKGMQSIRIDAMRSLYEKNFEKAKAEFRSEKNSQKREADEC